MGIPYANIKDRKKANELKKMELQNAIHSFTMRIDDDRRRQIRKEFKNLTEEEKNEVDKIIKHGRRINAVRDLKDMEEKAKTLMQEDKEISNTEEYKQIQKFVDNDLIPYDKFTIETEEALNKKMDDYIVKETIEALNKDFNLNLEYNKNQSLKENLKDLSKYIYGEAVERRLRELTKDRLGIEYKPTFNAVNQKREDENLERSIKKVFKR